MRKRRWSTSSELVKSFKFRSGIQADKISILNAVWDKELGHFSKYWALIGVKRGVLYVKPSSSAAAQELHMRSSEVVQGLNKYFGRAWIKAIRTSLK
ncbi:MAG: hypothetical protein A3J74_03940 [Elusimicrobia bacterium RIFCSPHIGHO2_02_FULL_57_9]|nr:MAG: hypothetical protein A3J74_03940 [Elusimicrobia bacterium RIFCSPHIGHO2_02_FULL_57_9]